MLIVAAVSAVQVRRRLGFEEADIADAITNTFIEDAAAYLGNQLEKALDPSNCTAAEAAAIADLAAIYCYLHKTGTAATSYTVNLGALSFTDPSHRIAQLEILREQVHAFIVNSKIIAFKEVQRDACHSCMYSIACCERNI